MMPRFAIFGTGSIVNLIIPFMQSKGFLIEALWGPDFNMTKDLALKLGIPFYTNSIDEVLLKKDVGLILIFCPPGLHCEIALKALGIGKHVLCDVPTGLSQSEVFQMKTAAQYYPLLSVLNFSMRFLPAFIQMKKAIIDNYIGQINICDVKVQCSSLIGNDYDWTCDSSNGGGALNIIGSHIIDLLFFITGERAVKASGLLCTFHSTTQHIKGIRYSSSDDFCTFQLKLLNDAICNVTINSLFSGNFLQEVLICGKGGHLFVRGGDLYGQKLGAQKEEVLYLEVEDLQQIPSNQLQSSLIPKLYAKGMMKLLASLKETFSFKEVWQQKPMNLAATFEDGQYVQAVIEAIYKSNLKQEWQPVNIISEKEKLTINIENTN